MDPENPLYSYLQVSCNFFFLQFCTVCYVFFTVFSVRVCGHNWPACVWHAQCEAWYLFSCVYGPHMCSMKILLPLTQGCIGSKGTSKVGLRAVTKAVGGGYQTGWGRLLWVTIAVVEGGAGGQSG